MIACTFFGHKECYDLKQQVLQDAIEDLIVQGVDTFYVGHQGQFDALVYYCLKELRIKYPDICIAVVLAYLPTQKAEEDELSDTMYPEIEGYPKFAIERRNRWMLSKSQFCICWINHTWGGAHKFAQQAKRRGLTVINLGNTNMQLNEDEDFRG